MEIYESRVRMREFIGEKWKNMKKNRGIWRKMEEYEGEMFDCVEL
jgi:hypothetical protein